MLLVMGSLGKQLLSPSRIILRNIVGELCLAVPTAYAIASYGEHNELPEAQVLVIGSLVALVGLEAVIVLIKKRMGLLKNV